MCVQIPGTQIEHKEKQNRKQKKERKTCTNCLAGFYLISHKVISDFFFLSAILYQKNCQLYVEIKTEKSTN